MAIFGSLAFGQTDEKFLEFKKIPTESAPKIKEFYNKLINGDISFIDQLYFDGMSETKRNLTVFTIQNRTRVSHEIESVYLVMSYDSIEANKHNVGLILRFKMKNSNITLTQFHEWIKTAEGWKCKPYNYQLP